VIPSAWAIRTRLLKLRFRSPRSTAPIHVRCRPVASANASWEYPWRFRSCRTRCPRATSTSCVMILGTTRVLDRSCFYVYRINEGSIYVA